MNGHVKGFSNFLIKQSVKHIYIILDEALSQTGVHSLLALLRVGLKSLVTDRSMLQYIVHTMCDRRFPSFDLLGNK